jgi:hypothetical protein
MNIELELHLEGQDANEDTLLDLMDWLERANIDGLMVKRKELPPAKGEMSFWTDPNTIMTLISTTIAVGQLVAAVIQWHKTKNEQVVITPKLNNPGKDLEETNRQIQALLEEMKNKKGKK